MTAAILLAASAVEARQLTFTTSNPVAWVAQSLPTE